MRGGFSVMAAVNCTFMMRARFSGIFNRFTGFSNTLANRSLRGLDSVFDSLTGGFCSFFNWILRLLSGRCKRQRGGSGED
jgi:hypothetical protein